MKIFFPSIDSIKLYENNSNKHPRSQIDQLKRIILKFGITTVCLVKKVNSKELLMVAGEGRFTAIKELYEEGHTLYMADGTPMKHCTLPVMYASNLTKDEISAYLIADNNIARRSETDIDVLTKELEVLNDLKFDLSILAFDGEYIENVLNINYERFDDLNQEQVEESHGYDKPPTLNEKYTTKVLTPIYEIKGEKPPISEIYNTTKTDQLVSEIMNHDLPDEIVNFLIAASNRHTVFNYEKIAEFYSHQSEEVKNLMESSALVIIDYEKAIEKSYVKLSDTIMRLSGENNSED